MSKSEGTVFTPLNAIHRKRTQKVYAAVYTGQYYKVCRSPFEFITFAVSYAHGFILCVVPGFSFVKLKVMSLVRYLVVFDV